MERVLIIKEMYFEGKKNIVEVADNLGVTKQYVSKVLKENFTKEYDLEKEFRKSANKEKRNKLKCEKMKERRVKNCDDSITAEDLRRQHDTAVRCMSKGKNMSTKSAVYSNINAYDIKRNALVYNDRVGARPDDLPKRFSLEINIY